MHLRTVRLFVFFVPLALGASRLFAATEALGSTRHLIRPTAISIPAAATATSELSLPPLPADVVELKFSALFKTPVGPRGLEISDELRALNHRRVRILGYMVREHAADHDEPAAAEDASSPVVTELVQDRLLLTTAPMMTNFSHYGLCEDLPPQTIYVTLSTPRGAPVPYTPQPLLLTGVLSVGIQSEPDGRTSIVRLKLDPADAPAG